MVWDRVNIKIVKLIMLNGRYHLLIIDFKGYLQTTETENIEDYLQILQYNSLADTLQLSNLGRSP